MRVSLRDRIIDAQGRIVRHGQYSYRLARNGDILRCHAGKENLEWLRSDGSIVTDWVKTKM